MQTVGSNEEFYLVHVVDLQVQVPKGQVPVKVQRLGEIPYTQSN